MILDVTGHKTVGSKCLTKFITYIESESYAVTGKTANGKLEKQEIFHFIKEGEKLTTKQRKLYAEQGPFQKFIIEFLSGCEKLTASIELQLVANDVNVTDTSKKANQNSDINSKQKATNDLQANILTKELEVKEETKTLDATSLGNDIETMAVAAKQEEANVENNMIESKEEVKVTVGDESETINKVNQISVGDRVYADCDWDEWYPGVVDSVNDDGTYNINFDDGDYVENVLEEQIEMAGEETEDHVDGAAQEMDPNAINVTATNVTKEETSSIENPMVELGAKNAVTVASNVANSVKSKKGASNMESSSNNQVVSASVAATVEKTNTSNGIKALNVESSLNNQVVSASVAATVAATVEKTNIPNGIKASHVESSSNNQVVAATVEKTNTSNGIKASNVESSLNNQVVAVAASVAATVEKPSTPNGLKASNVESSLNNQEVVSAAVEKSNTSVAASVAATVEKPNIPFGFCPVVS
eukprot:g71.t1